MSSSLFCNGAIDNRSKYAMLSLLISRNRCKMNKTLARFNLIYMRDVYQTISALSPNFNVTESDITLLFTGLGHFKGMPKLSL